MTAVTVTIRNCVDTEKFFATLDLIEAQPELAVWESIPLARHGLNRRAAASHLNAPRSSTKHGGSNDH
jgi:hypothetical protein